MPIDILLDKQSRILRTHGSGYVAVADFIDSMEKTIQLMDSGVIDSQWGQVIDLTDVSNVEELSESDISLIACKSPWPPGVRRAIVVSEEERARHLAGIYQSLGSEKGHKIRVVETIEEALQWVRPKETSAAS